MNITNLSLLRRACWMKQRAVLAPISPIQQHAQRVVQHLAKARQANAA